MATLHRMVLDTYHGIAWYWLHTMVSHGIGHMSPSRSRVGSDDRGRIAGGGGIDPSELCQIQAFSAHSQLIKQQKQYTKVV